MTPIPESGNNLGYRHESRADPRAIEGMRPANSDRAVRLDPAQPGARICERKENDGNILIQDGCKILLISRAQMRYEADAKWTFRLSPDVSDLVCRVIRLNGTNWNRRAKGAETAYIRYRSREFAPTIPPHGCRDDRIVQTQ